DGVTFTAEVIPQVNVEFALGEGLSPADDSAAAVQGGVGSIFGGAGGHKDRPARCRPLVPFENSATGNDRLFTENRGHHPSAIERLDLASLGNTDLDVETIAHLD